MSFDIVTKLLWSKSKFDERESSLVVPLVWCTIVNRNSNFFVSIYVHLLQSYVSQINALPHTRSQRVTCDDEIIVKICLHTAPAHVKIFILLNAIGILLKVTVSYNMITIMSQNEMNFIVTSHVG